MEDDADRQDQYVNVVQNAVEGALQAAMHLDNPEFFDQKQILIMELVRAKAYASQLKPGPANDAGPISASCEDVPAATLWSCPSRALPAIASSLRDGSSPQIGDKMPAGHKHAGWIYAGISRTTHEPFYVAPKDSGVFKWKEATAFALREGSRVPSKEELDQLYEARDKGALKDTFNVTGSDSAGWYWSSRDYGNYGAWAQRFSDGDQDCYYENHDSSLRCVR